jgi:hypothetical protein
MLKINGLDQVLVYVNYVNLVVVYINKNNVEILLQASIEKGLEVNIDKTKYMHNTKQESAI